MRKKRQRRGTRRLPALMLIALCTAVMVMAGARENIAVFELEKRGGLNENEVKMIADRISGELFAFDTFRVVERTQIDDILREQGFQQSGACTDQQCLVEVGQLLAVHKMVGGSIGKIEDLYTVTLKFVDVASGEILAQRTGDYRGNKATLLSQYIPVLTRSLIHAAGYGGSPSAADTRVVAKQPEPKHEGGSAGPVEPRAEEKEGSGEAGPKKRGAGSGTSLVRKPGFWIPVTAVAGGAAALAVFMTRSAREEDTDKDEDGGNDGGEALNPALPDHPDPH